jgi:hypothetical protein
VNDAGYKLFASVFTGDEIERLLERLPGVERAGTRSLLDNDKVQPIARDARLKAIVGSDFFAVRALLFDKTAEANWALGWHQDTTVAVRERRDVAGFGPWTVKGGVPHAVAPADLLARMVTLRVHLDECGAEAGPLRVKPGSHLHGRLTNDDLERWAGADAVECTASRGDVLVFSPLLLHGSASSTGAAHRRVLQLEYSSDLLPGGLEWRWQI